LRFSLNGKKIRFVNFLYATTDKEIIKFLLWKAKNPRPGSRVYVENVNRE